MRKYEVLESIHDAVVVSDSDGKIVYVNRQAERPTGYRRIELIGRGVEVRSSPACSPAHVEYRRGFYTRGVARLMGTLDSDFRLWRKIGSGVAVEISLGPAGDDIAAVRRDFTERHRLEVALERRALHDPHRNALARLTDL